MENVKWQYTEFLLSNLNSLRENRILCDVKILVSGNTFLAHKVVLCAGSQYFRSMFCSGMTETFSEEISLQEISSEIFALLLNFFYSGEVKITSGNAQDLLIAGKMIQLDALVEQCCEFIKLQLDINNCLGILSFSHFHSCDDLFKTALSFVHKNFQEVCEGEEFLQLDQKTLVAFLKSDKIKVSSENDVVISMIKWTLHEAEKRCSFFKTMLNYVKLPLISPEIMKSYLVSCDHMIKSEMNEAYETCLLEQQSSNHLKYRSPRTYCKKYFYVLGGVMRKPGGTWTELISLSCTERCEVPQLGFTKSVLQLTCELETADVSAMNQPRSDLAVAMINNLVYAIGGENDSLIYDSIECYNPFTNQWSFRSSMVTPRVSHGACVINGEIYVVGGWIGGEIARTMEKYNPDDDEWMVVGEIPTARFDAGVCEMSGKLYVIGGQDENGDILCTIDVYDPVRERWGNISPMLHKRASACVVSLNNFIYAIGGYNLTSCFHSVERYDFTHNCWEKVAPLPHACQNACATHANNFIYVFGGRENTQNNFLNDIFCYDVTKNKWSTAGLLKVGKSNAAVVVV